MAIITATPADVSEFELGAVQDVEDAVTQDVDPGLLLFSRIRKGDSEGASRATFIDLATLP